MESVSVGIIERRIAVHLPHSKGCHYWLDEIATLPVFVLRLQCLDTSKEIESRVVSTLAASPKQTWIIQCLKVPKREIFDGGFFA